MQELFNKMVDSMCEDCLVHTHVKDLWVIDSKTKQWIISFHPPTNYAWWNYDFFSNIYKYLSMDIKDREPIRNWVQSRMNVGVDLCEPDRLPGDYDWSGDFNVDHIVSNGLPLTETNEIINIINSRVENRWGDKL
jgi:hypothetical protein